MTSNTVITDSKWHHVGLVYDGTEKRLYVVGQEVAKDSLSLLFEPDVLRVQTSIQ